MRLVGPVVQEGFSMTARNTIDFTTLRHRMVEQDLKGRGISNPRVLAAMAEVPREEFVPEELRESAYDDRALPIGFHQTISQPYTVAVMLEALNLSSRDTVLEIGTGSGYAAAVLAQLVATVQSVERVPELAQAAERRLQRLGYRNVQVHVGDGSLGLEESGPFDAIVVTAAAEVLPPPYAKQLVEGGRLVIPLGDSYSQNLYRFTKKEEHLVSEDLGGFAFVPLIGRYGR